MDLFFSVFSGSVAGLALAAPLGAIGILLLQEGITRGLRRGIPAAAAVTTVDVLYCTIAVAAGSLAGPIVNSWTPWPQILGGFAVIALGVHGLLKIRRVRMPEVGRASRRSSTSGHRYLLFLGLTALNPATLVYFAAIVTGLNQFTDSPPTAVAFTAGVGVASFAWQCLLVALGAGLRRKTGPSFRKWTAFGGNGLVVVLGVAFIFHAL
jgi:arginine exporter protein ArgO